MGFKKMEIWLLQDQNSMSRTTNLMHYSTWSVDKNDNDFVISRKWVEKHSLQFEMVICTQIGLIYASCKDSLDMMLNHQGYGHVDRFIDQDFQNKFSILQNLNFCAKKKNLMTVWFIVWSWRSTQLQKFDKIASRELKSLIARSLIEISKDVRDQGDDRQVLIPPMMMSTITLFSHKIAINK